MTEQSTGGDGAAADLERELGLLDCVLLSVGGMVGSAVFIYPGTTGQLTGPSAILAWVGAGLLMGTIALCYTELSLAFPRSGGPAVFPYETFGPSRFARAFASYLEGVSYVAGWVVGITISALAIADYVAVAAPAASGHTVPLAVLAIALSFGVNVLGVNLASRTNLVLSAALLAVLLLFAGLGLARADPANYRPFVLDGPVRFLAAVNVATVAYGAWTVIPASAEEIREPARTIPRAIVASLAVSTVVYGAVVAALHGQVAPGAFAEGTAVETAPLGVAASAIGLPLLRDALLPFAALVAIFTTMLVGTMSAGRVLFALGRNDTLPAAFATVSDRFHVPWVALAVVSALAGALATVPEYFFQLLVVSAIVGTGLPYAINVLSFVGLRYYRTDVDPPFRAPGGYALPAVAFVALAVAMIGLGSTEVVWSVGALAILAVPFLIRYLQAPDEVTGSARTE